MSKALAKLIDDKAELLQFQKMDEFLELVNLDPPEAWLENHPLAKGVKYLPIERVEWLLTKMFQEWKTEVLRIDTMFNSITVVVRLHYKHPLTGWTYSDGVAAVPAKTAKGAKASDMNEILSEAVMTGLPAAKSFAIKDAADHIGKIFGRDINRKNNLSFNASYKLDEDEKTLEALQDADTEEQIQNILTNLPSEKLQAYTPVAKRRLEELRNGNSNRD